MVNLYKLAGLILLGLTVWCGAASAQVVIRAPFVSVDVFGPNVFVRAPGVMVDVRGYHPGFGVVTPFPPPGYVVPAPAYVVPAPAYVVPAPTQIYTLPPPRLVTPVDVAAPVGPQPVTVVQFVNHFKPIAGTHRAVLMHPFTRQAVSVEFTLPEGCRKIRYDENELEFDCGDREVEIRFMVSGGVKVEYHE